MKKILDVYQLEYWLCTIYYCIVFMIVRGAWWKMKCKKRLFWDEMCSFKIPLSCSCWLKRFCHSGNFSELTLSWRDKHAINPLYLFLLLSFVGIDWKLLVAMVSLVWCNHWVRDLMLEFKLNKNKKCVCQILFI